MDLREVKSRKNAILNRHPWELARLEVVDHLLNGIIKNADDYTILDIGCGDIYFITELSNRYPKAHFYAIDIEFTDELINELKSLVLNKNIYLFKSLDEASSHLKKPADLVLLLDVVEHIKEDVQFLTSLSKNTSISFDTNIIITVPAHQRLFNSHDYFLGHYRRYTNASLLNTIQKSGFTKIELGYFFLSLIPPRFLQVLKEKVIKPNLDNSSTGLVDWDKGELISTIFKTILLLDFKVGFFIKKHLGINLPGLSNYIICKKLVS